MKKVALLSIMLPTLLLSAGKSLYAAPTPKDSVERRVYSASRDLAVLQGLLTEYRNQGDSTAAGITLYHIGRYYNQNSEYIESINAYREAMAAHNTNRDSYETVRTAIGLATSERRIGAYSDAAAELYNALRVLEESDYVDTDEGKRHHSYLYNGLGNVYKYLNNGVEAERYFRLSLFYDGQINNYTGMAMNWSTIGSIYEYRSQYDSAAVMYQRALDYNQRGRSTSGVGICLNRLGQLSGELGDMDKAESLFLAAYDSLSKARDRWNLAKSTMSLAAIYIDKGDLKKAKQYIDESYDLAGGKHSYGHDQEIHSLWAMYHAKSGNYKDAYEESRIAIAYLDSAAALKNEEEVSQNRISFIQEENRREMNRVLQEKEHEATLKKSVLIGGIISSAVLFLLLVLVYRYWKLQRKLNKHLADNNSLRDKLLSIISHDLKNPLIAQRNTLKFLDDNLENIPPEVLKSQIAELNRSSEYTLDLFTKLLDWTRLQTGRMNYEPIRVDLHNVCDDTLNILSAQIRQKNIKTNVLIPKETFAFCDINMLGTVLRNLVSNAIKYSNWGGEIEIGCHDQENGIMRVYVKDFGVGISNDFKELLLSGNNHISSTGTSGEKGTALGLIICKEFVELASGEIGLESSPSKGSTFSFTVMKSD